MVVLLQTHLPANCNSPLNVSQPIELLPASTASPTILNVSASNRSQESLPARQVSSSSSSKPAQALLTSAPSANLLTTKPPISVGESTVLSTGHQGSTRAPYNALKEIASRLGYTALGELSPRNRSATKAGGQVAGRPKYTLPSWFNYQLYKRFHGKRYLQPADNEAHKRIYLRTALRVFEQRALYRAGRLSSLSSVNEFSDLVSGLSWALLLVIKADS